MTIVRCGAQLQASNLVVTHNTQLPRDGEECRLFGVYEASSAKEHAAASKLLTPHHGLSNSEYIELLANLRAVRTKCNKDMLAIEEHHEKIRELLPVQ
jgi:hypothetical protein